MITMVPKRRTMLLVAVVGARTTLVGCSQDSGCHGFYPLDDAAPIDAMTQQDVTNGCFGFCIDASLDVAHEAESGDAGDASSDSNDE